MCTANRKTVSFSVSFTVISCWTLQVDELWVRLLCYWFRSWKLSELIQFHIPYWSWDVDSSIKTNWIQTASIDAWLLLPSSDGRKWSCQFSQLVIREKCKVQLRKMKIHLIIIKKVPGSLWQTLEVSGEWLEVSGELFKSTGSLWSEVIILLIFLPVSYRFLSWPLRNGSLILTEYYRWCKLVLLKLEYIAAQLLEYLLNAWWRMQRGMSTVSFMALTVAIGSTPWVFWRVVGTVMNNTGT